MFNHFTESERELLQTRTRQIAVNKHDKQDEQVQNALRCRIGPGWYALPLPNLSAIYQGVTVVSISGVPPHLRGIANIRGRIVPVLDLGQLLGLAATDGDVGELLVIDHKKGTVALWVNQVDDVLTYTESEQETVPDDIHTPGITAILPDGTLLLIVAPLLDDPTIIIDTQSKQRNS